MTIRTLAGFGLSALLVTGTIAVVAHGVVPAMAGSRSDPKADRKAAEQAGKAQKAMAKKQWTKAIGLAEAAVALNGEDAGYRALLGAAYLRGGRFASAEQAYGDVMTLQPENGHAALNLALAQIATGKWDGARATLERHAGTIPAADRGLALALAGDPTGAVEVLTNATRSPDADAKTRQNLALAMALAGRWQEARSLLGVDMTPVDADTRVIEWARFAQPQSASDQVAALLGVTPAIDPGQPVAIALNGTMPAVAAATPVDPFMPGAPDNSVEDAPVETASAETVPVIVAAGAYKVAAAKPAIATVPRVRAVAARAPAKGNWVVQIGAFQNAAVARDGWSRALRRQPVLSGYMPVTMSTTLKGATFYRLSVGGFARNDAAALCQRYRARGGTCFVRVQAGDQIAAWHRAGVQLASR